MTSELAIASPSPDGFPVARCRECARDVLAWPDLEGEAPVWRCVTCDERIADSALSWIAAAGLGSLGYEIHSEAPKKSGCSGCSSGGACGVKTAPKAVPNQEKIE